MSSRGDGWRGVLSYLDDNPAVDASLELIVVVAATFVPFLIAAVWPAFYSPTFVAEQVGAGFLSFFRHGELSFLLLGACGTIAWLFFIRMAVPSKLGKFLMALLVLVLIVIGFGVVAGNPGFEKEPASWMQIMLLLSYFVALATWYAVLLRIRFQEFGGGASEKRAKGLLERAGRTTE